MIGRPEVTNAFNIDIEKSMEARKRQYCGVIQTLQETDSKHNATEGGRMQSLLER